MSRGAVASCSYELRNWEEESPDCDEYILI